VPSQPLGGGLDLGEGESHDGETVWRKSRAT